MCRSLVFEARPLVYSYALVISQQGRGELSVLGILPVRFFPACLGMPLCDSGGGPMCPKGLRLYCSKGFPALNLKNSSGLNETSLKSSLFWLKNTSLATLGKSPRKNYFATYF